VAVIQAVGNTDPPAALASARQTDNRSYLQQALVAAAASQPKADALALYREATETPPINSMNAAMDSAHIAACASRFDMQEGRHLLDPALQYVQSAQYRYDAASMNAESRLNLLCHFAYFAGQVAPQETRPLLVEIAYRQGVQQLPAGDWALQAVPHAMAVIDVTRSLEMVDELYPKPADLDARRSAQGEIFRYLVASDEERLTEYPEAW
jgi:hypothetical protein